MTALLEQVLERVYQLPEEQQNSIASFIENHFLLTLPHTEKDNVVTYSLAELEASVGMTDELREQLDLQIAEDEQ